MIGGFFCATPSDGIYTGRPSHLSLAAAHQLLSVRRSTPRDTRTKRQKQHPLQVIRWSDNAYITHYCAAAALIPERLRWNIACAGNCLPLANSSYYSPSRPGVRSVFGVVEIVLCYNNAVRQKPQRIDLYRAAYGRENATRQPSDAPRNIRQHRQVQRAAAEYTSPRYVQHSGRVRLI